MSELHGVCGNCGQDLGIYQSGSRHTTSCPRCKAKLLIEARDRGLTVTVIETKQERQEASKTA